MAEKIFKIKGTNGKKTLTGTLFVNGAKNAALKAIASTMLFKNTVVLHSVPWTEDTKNLVLILKGLGAKVDIKNYGSKNAPGVMMEIDPSGVNSDKPDRVLSEKMRASVTLTGPLLGRFGNVSFPVPGGCVIGERPIDLFVKGYEKMGATTTVSDGVYNFSVGEKKLKGAEIFFDMQTVGGTETLMMAGILAEGKTVLRNCALEPEIVSLAQFLVANGAEIEGIGTTKLTIHGRGGELLTASKPYTTVPDRIEAGTFMILGALLGRDLTVSGVVAEHVQSLTSLFEKYGIYPTIVKGKEGVCDFIFSENTDKGAEEKTKDASNLSFVKIRTHEYPGFPTDLQSPIATFLSVYDREAQVFETIYEGRFKYIENLQKMGANIEFLNSREIVINKGKSSSAKIALKAPSETIDAYDIRAGFAMIIAGAYADGETQIKNIRFIDRGYEDIENRLKSIGVDIERVDVI